MNCFENECNKELKEENKRRKKDGLPTRKRNITFIDCKDVQSEKTKHNRSPEEQEKLKKRHLVMIASAVIFDVASEFSKLQGKIKYRINEINKSSKIIDFNKNIYTNDLHKLNKKCGLLYKKYTDISDKIEQEQLETCIDKGRKRTIQKCFDKYVEDSDIVELNKIHKSFVKIWNSYANFIKKQKELKS